MIIKKLKLNHKLLLASFALVTAASNYASQPTSNGFHLPSLPGGLGLAPQYQLAIAASARNMSPADQVDIYNTFMDQAAAAMSSGNLASTVDALQSALTMNQKQGLTDFFNQDRFSISSISKSGLDLKTIGLSVGLSDSDASLFAQKTYVSPYKNPALSTAPPVEDAAVTDYENAMTTSNFDTAIKAAQGGDFSGLAPLRQEDINIAQQNLATAETIRNIYDEQLAANGVNPAGTSGEITDSDLGITPVGPIEPPANSFEQEFEELQNTNANNAADLRNFSQLSDTGQSSLIQSIDDQLALAKRLYDEQATEETEAELRTAQENYDELADLHPM